MILIGHFLKAVAELLNSVISLCVFLFIARAILSWVDPNPSNIIVRFIYDTTEPVLRYIRRYIKPIGMLDLSVLVAILVLFFLKTSLVAAMADYGSLLLNP